MAIGYTGVPNKKRMGDLRKLKTNAIVDYIVQNHYSKRQNKSHYDVRLGLPHTGLYSWAIPKAKLPEDNEKLLAIRTPIHSYKYKNFKGIIPTGYGAGRVDRKVLGKATIHRATPKTVSYSTKNGNLYHIIRTKNKTWLMFKAKNNKYKVQGIK